MSEVTSQELQLVETEAYSPEVVVVRVRGDADLRIAARLRAELEHLSAAGYRRIVIDLSTSFFIDSAALGVLLGAAKRQRPLGGQIRVVSPSPHVRRMFELTLLDRLFGPHLVVPDAVESFGP